MVVCDGWMDEVECDGGLPKPFLQALKKICFGCTHVLVLMSPEHLRKGENIYFYHLSRSEKNGFPLEVMALMTSRYSNKNRSFSTVVNDFLKESHRYYLQIDKEVYCSLNSLTSIIRNL